MLHSEENLIGQGKGGGGHELANDNCLLCKELRLEIQRGQQAAQCKGAMKMLNKSLEVLETKLPHFMKMLQPVSEKLADKR